MKEEEIAKTVIDSMKSVTDGMKSFLKTESPKPVSYTHLTLPPNSLV